jgi:hypothetical protein
MKNVKHCPVGKTICSYFESSLAHFSQNFLAIAHTNFHICYDLQFAFQSCDCSWPLNLLDYSDMDTDSAVKINKTRNHDHCTTVLRSNWSAEGRLKNSYTLCSVMFTNIKLIKKPTDKGRFTLTSDYQFRVSSVSVPCKFRISAVTVPYQFRISDVSVPYQCRVSSVSVPSVRCPTQIRQMHFKQNHSHISGALNGRYWYGTDTALITVNRA